MANFSNGGTVYAGFIGPGQSGCVASATISWDDNFVVSVSDVRYSYTSGSSLSFTCKWRVRPLSGGSALAGTDQGTSSFNATSGVTYVFQACASGPYEWGNSTKPEGEDGSSYFTVTESSGGGGDSGEYPEIQIYNIRYDANGGTGAPSTHFKEENEIVYLYTETPTKADTDEGAYTLTFDARGGSCSVKTLQSNITKSYSFKIWNTKRDGSGVNYSPGASYSGNANLYLYAIYNEATSVKQITLPVANRGGYEFLGWSTNAGSVSGITGSYTPKDNITFYAIWKANGLVYIYDGTQFVTFQAFIYDGSGWDMYCPYVYDSEWSLCS